MFDFQTQDSSHYPSKNNAQSSRLFNYSILQPWGKHPNVTVFGLSTPHSSKIRQPPFNQNTFDLLRKIKQKPFTSCKSPRTYKVFVADITLIPKQSQWKVRQRKNSKLKTVKSKTFSKCQSLNDTKRKCTYAVQYEGNSKQLQKEIGSKQLFYKDIQLKQSGQKRVSQGHSDLISRRNRLKIRMSDQNRDKCKSRFNCERGKGIITSVILNRKVINDPQCYKKALDFAVQRETVMRMLSNKHSRQIFKNQITHKNLDLLELAIENKPKKITKVKSSYIGMQKIMKKPSIAKKTGYDSSLNSIVMH